MTIPHVATQNIYTRVIVEDNARDMIERNRGVDNKGEKHGNSKLKNEDIIKIREINNSLSYRGIATIYDICHYTVQKICLRQSWRHIP